MLALVKKDVIKTYNTLYFRDLKVNPDYLSERLNQIYDSWKQEQPNLDTYLEKACAQSGLPVFEIKSLFAQFYHLLKVQENCVDENNINTDLNNLCFTILV